MLDQSAKCILVSQLHNHAYCWETLKFHRTFAFIVSLEYEMCKDQELVIEIWLRVVSLHIF